MVRAQPARSAADASQEVSLLHFSRISRGLLGQAKETGFAARRRIVPSYTETMSHLGVLTVVPARSACQLAGDQSCGRASAPPRCHQLNPLLNEGRHVNLPSGGARPLRWKRGHFPPRDVFPSPHTWGWAASRAGLGIRSLVRKRAAHERGEHHRSTDRRRPKVGSWRQPAISLAPFASGAGSFTTIVCGASHAAATGRAASAGDVRADRSSAELVHRLRAELDASSCR